MTLGFKNKISCLGIIGDGCGGGREFIIENETLYSYDPYSKESLVLLQNIKDAQSISKHRCTLTIECKNETIKFDLQALQIIS